MSRSIRQPGPLPNVAAITGRLRNLLGKLPQQSAKELQAIIEAVLALGEAQHEFNRRQWEGYDSLPQRHALTHMGGGDSVCGRDTPATITPDAAGAIGSPQAGYAPIGHIHPIATDPAVPVGAGNAEGASSAFARADHQHDGVPWVAMPKPHLHRADEIRGFAAAVSGAVDPTDANIILAVRSFGGF